MKAAFRLLLVSLLLPGAASLAQQQAPAVSHNTWTSGTPMPTALFQPVVGVLKGQIYVAGGYNGSPLSGTQVYNPVTNAWSSGVSLPIAINGASGAVVKNIMYVIGGSRRRCNWPGSSGRKAGPFSYLMTQEARDFPSCKGIR